MKGLKHKRKHRTREHIIADLSVNHLEYFVLKNGFTLEKFNADYGYDAELYTYDKMGEFENGLVYIQLKATDHLEVKQLRSGKLSFSIEKQHLEIWLHELMPVILVLFDAQKERAYWLYLQLYFEQHGLTLDSIQTDSFSIHFNKDNLVDLEAIIKWRDYKNLVLSQLKGGIKRYV